MGVKAVFFDLDGTLLMDNRTISKSSICAINELKKQGILVGIATGRGPRFVLQYMAALGLDVAVTYNGQYIFTRDQVLYSKELDKADLLNMIGYAAKHKKDLSFGTATGVAGSRIMHFGHGDLVYRLTRLVPDSWAGMVTFAFNRIARFFKPQKLADLEEELHQPIYQMMLLSTESESQQLAQRFPQLSVTRSSLYAADILSKGVSKLHGIERVGKRYGFRVDEVMAFGDADNDLEMLNGVGYAVAMGNATTSVKQAARYVTATNNQDGICQALRHFSLIKEASDVSE